MSPRAHARTRSALRSCVTRYHEPMPGLWHRLNTYIVHQSYVFLFHLPHIALHYIVILKLKIVFGVRISREATQWGCGLRAEIISNIIRRGPVPSYTCIHTAPPLAFALGRRNILRFCILFICVCFIIQEFFRCLSKDFKPGFGFGFGFPLYLSLQLSSLSKHIRYSFATHNSSAARSRSRSRKIVEAVRARARETRVGEKAMLPRQSHMNETGGRCRGRGLKNHGLRRRHFRDGESVCQGRERGTSCDDVSARRTQKNQEPQ